MKSKNESPLIQNYSGKIGGIVFQKNGRLRINSLSLIKRKSKKKQNHEKGL